MVWFFFIVRFLCVHFVFRMRNSRDRCVLGKHINIQISNVYVYFILCSRSFTPGLIFIFFLFHPAAVSFSIESILSSLFNELYLLLYLYFHKPNRIAQQIAWLCAMYCSTLFSALIGFKRRRLYSIHTACISIHAHSSTTVPNVISMCRCFNPAWMIWPSLTVLACMRQATMCLRANKPVTPL